MTGRNEESANGRTIRRQQKPAMEELTIREVVGGRPEITPIRRSGTQREKMGKSVTTMIAARLGVIIAGIRRRRRGGFTANILMAVHDMIVAIERPRRGITQRTDQQPKYEQSFQHNYRSVQDLLAANQTPMDPFHRANATILPGEKDSSLIPQKVLGISIIRIRIVDVLECSSVNA